MAWVKIRNNLPNDPRVVGVSAAAMGLWLAAACYTARNRSQGLIPTGAIVGADDQLIGELLGAGMVEPHVDGFVMAAGFFEIEERREAIPQDMRAAVIRRDGYQCGICGGQVDPGDVHLDHVRPVSKGGVNTIGNLRVTHSMCNIRRGNREA